MTGRGHQGAGAAGGPPATEKLQKVLARAGLGSRRELEQWICDGRVQVNGARAELGARVSPADEIRVDGRVLQGVRGERARPRVLRYHKPAGEVCTRRDPEGRPTVFEHLPGIRGRRWIAVGRLDVNTTGLLLFTDSGELAHRLMHPSSQVEREYAVRVYGTVAPDALVRVASGVELEDGVARFDDLRDAGGEGRNHWYRVCVREGRNHLVRRLWASQGVEVSRLTRVRYAGVELPRRLRAGRWDELPADQVRELLQAAGMPAPDQDDVRRPGGSRGTAHGGAADDGGAGPRQRGRGGPRSGTRAAAPRGGRRGERIEDDGTASGRAPPPARGDRGAARRGRGKPRR